MSLHQRGDRRKEQYILTRPWSARGEWFEWEYVGKEDETLVNIAWSFYGHISEATDEYYQRRIWLVNRRTIGDYHSHLRRGTWLRVPYYEFPYRVWKGDTLSRIALWIYGDADRVERILDTNPEIEDPNEIKVGQELWIYPPRYQT
jgi:nucleoid-associated protein YgaU